MTIENDTVVVVSRSQVACDLADETAILNTERGIYYGLNPVGARIWKLIQTPRPVREVLEAVLDEYDVEPDRCERDVLALLEHLVDEGLIEVKNEPGA